MSPIPGPACGPSRLAEDHRHQPAAGVAGHGGGAVQRRLPGAADRRPDQLFVRAGAGDPRRRLPRARGAPVRPRVRSASGFLIQHMLRVLYEHLVSYPSIRIREYPGKHPGTFFFAAASKDCTSFVAAGHAVPL